MLNQGRLPLYIQLSELLIREITAGRLLDGEKLPPERIMAQELNTTVRTLRKALNDLTNKGLLERRQGSGNYICAKTDVQSIYSFFRIELINGGGLPSTKVLSVDKLKKPMDFPQFGTSDSGYRIRRLRYLNNIPSVLEEIWLDSSYADHIEADNLCDSLYLFYKDVLKFWIMRVEDQLGISKVPEWKPKEFGLNCGKHCGFIERISWAQNNQTAEYSQNWFDHNKVRYVARIK